MLKKDRVDYYVLIVIIGALIIWFQFTAFNINKSTSDELKTEVDSLKIEARILKEKVKKDTIIINLNLKQK